ncbi:MFS transporter [Virgisporangium aurantiacum]|uniref:MFS transporter n=1 Tax=Virgisporangium aurantiacum TaxID=175570 RepID=A0A8J3Z9Z0_9ACTN|nr:MFS transporter [Virgisporangium aurantiacum]GIJ60106.1 MFS transporter [Virgisporangium aurantiacum]
MSPYRQVFAAPGTVLVAVAGVVARMGHFMTVLGTVLFVSATTGSYGLAGAVAAGYALAYAAVSPVTSRLVDRIGCRRVLVPATVCTTGARVALLVAVWAHASAPVLVTLAAAAGGSTPAIGSLVRARWSRLYRGSPLLHPALSFESVMEETILVVGPVAVTALAGWVDPSAGLIAAVVLATAGLAALAVGMKGDARSVAAQPSGDAIRGLGPLLAAFAAVAVATITVEVAVVASTEPAAAGWILATMALSSALCGLWYGVRRWRRPPRDRLMWTVALLAVTSLGFAAAPNVPALFAAAALFGLTLAPTFIDGFAVVHETVPAHRLTEGLTWMTTAAGVGIAVGSATAGQVVDARGTTVTFLVATGFAAAAVPTARFATT